MNIRVAPFVIALAMLAPIAPDLVAQQTQPPQTPPPLPVAQPPVVVSQEALLLAQGWGYLSAGDVAHAAGVSAQVLTQFPLSEAGLALGIEIELVRTGWLGALDLYERWLGARHMDEPYGLRRIARASLREALHNAEARTIALEALITDGDQDALAQATAESRAGKFSDTQALAKIGDERAVRALIAELDTMPDARGPIILALGQSRNRIAVPALVKLLGDQKDETQAKAAEALGLIGDSSVADKLRPLLDTAHPPFVRFAAARALGQLGDASGTAFIRNAMDSTTGQPGMSYYRVQAAAALAAIGPDTGWLDTARSLLSDPDPNVRAEAAQIVAPYDNAAAKDALTTLTADPNPAIRQKAGQIPGRARRRGLRDIARAPAIV